MFPDGQGLLLGSGIGGLGCLSHTKMIGMDVKPQPCRGPLARPVPQIKCQS